MQISKALAESRTHIKQNAFDIHSVPGHLIRRAQQIAVAIFAEETTESGLTPIQFALLAELERTSGADQVTLAALIAVDVATFGQVATRLEERGLVARESDPEDRRRKRLTLTTAGRACLKRSIPAVLSTQERILAPLDTSERRELCRLLSKLVEQNNESSRAPMRRAAV